MGIAKGLKNMTFKKLSAEKIAEEGLSGKLMPYRFTKPVAAALVAGSFIKEGISSYKNPSMGDVSMGENLDRLISLDGSGFLNKLDSATQGDADAIRDVVNHTFDNPNQYFSHNNLVFALHNRRDG